MSSSLNLFSILVQILFFMKKLYLSSNLIFHEKIIIILFKKILYQKTSKSEFVDSNDKYLSQILS